MAYTCFSFFFIFLFPFLSQALPTIQCSRHGGGPHIRFPFRIIDGREQNRTGFELVCQGNATLIHFPDYGNLVVKSISYDLQRLDLLDPNNCVHQVFLNLNLLQTPFRYFFLVKNYTYLNCSTRLPSSFEQVSCLSDSRNHVYSVEPSFPAPVSCRKVKTVAIPFAYSPYLADNSFGLGLTWSTPPGCDQDFLSKTGFSMEMLLKVMVLWVVAVTVILSIKICRSKKVNEEYEKLVDPINRIL